ncbi:MAG: S41 family peptidase [Clostridiales bacterium]|nr:S41 family peptidase [Clostridiales bacterium]
MHKKISIGLMIAIVILTLIATALVTTAVTMTAYSDLIADLPQREAMYDSLSEIDSLVRSEYLGNPEEESIDSGIAQGYIDSLTVGINEYMTAEEYADYKTLQSGISLEDGSEITGVTYSKFGSAGYIKITDFYDTTAAAFSSACTALIDNSVTGIVIDVRDTDSINIQSAADIIDLIVPLASDNTEAIATAVDKDGNNIEIFSADSASIDLSFAVIVNENTRGAGELIAADLRDFSKGSVVGKTTAGLGTYKKIY